MMVDSSEHPVLLVHPAAANLSGQYFADPGSSMLCINPSKQKTEKILVRYENSDVPCSKNVEV